MFLRSTNTCGRHGDLVPAAGNRGHSETETAPGLDRSYYGVEGWGAGGLGAVSTDLVLTAIRTGLREAAERNQ